MEYLLDKIYNREIIDNRQIKAVKDYFTALDFIIVEDDYRTLPRRILTTYGILDLVGNYDEECDKFSGITETYALSIPDIYGYSSFLSRNSYKAYYYIIVTFLLTHKNILIEFLNKKYNLKLEEKDISRKFILGESILEHKKKKFNTLRNYSSVNGIKYVKADDVILMVKGSNVYKLGGEYENSRHNITRKHRRSEQYHKNERSYGVATTY